MPITVTSRDGVLTIALSGEIDHQVARDMMDAGHDRHLCNAVERPAAYRDSAS